MSEEPPQLGSGKRDYVAAVLRGAVGAVPFVGPAFSELITQTIPNVRAERIERYLVWLTRKLEHLDDKEIAEHLTEPEAQWVFEEGGIQSARATADLRQEQIASVVAHGISEGQASALEARRLLTLLAQIDDQQVIMLASYLTKNMFDDDFMDRHGDILAGPALHMKSPEEDVGKQALHDFAKGHLISLGLLRQSFKNPKKGQLPEFDKNTGMIKASGYQLTSLGRLLLRRIGLAQSDDV